MNEIGFFFNYGDLVVQLPINPEELEIKFTGNNEKTEIISLGEINLLRDRKLATLSFESFFPESDWFPAVRTTGKFESAPYYKKFFEGIMKDKKPVRLVVTGIDINMLVSVEEFSYKHKAGDHEDAYYKISLCEYRSYGIKSISLATTTSDGTTTLSKVEQKTTGRQETQITVGSSVILNGTVYRDSYGNGAGKTYSNYSARVNLINKKGTHIYHVTTPSGGPLGWVKAEAVKLA